ncbi:MAG: GntR family transcriptional regulator [Gemmatimonadaceae bacterium]|jgi:DNA-binding LacI/PurR family transcriptional regulator|nr:GntR family transcriptional regulator [Gemmatimonadaceae bacterium]
MRIDHATATPLYQQIATEIRRQIVDGELVVGQRLPPHRQLAKQLGVSLITINKALSGLVSEGVLISRVGYGTTVAVRPAAMAMHTLELAAASRAGAGPALGFVLRDLNSPYFSMVATACEKHAHSRGHGLLVLSSGNVAEREDVQLRRLLAAGVQGLVVVSMSRTTYRLSESLLALQQQGFPFVMVSFTVGDNVPFIGSNLDLAGELAVEHLLAMGRRRFGYLTDRFGSLSGAARSAAFRRVAQERGHPIDDAFVFEYPYEGEWNDFRSGRALGQHIAGLSSRPDAMYVFNDLGALGLIEGLTSSGLRVPDDVAVVGFDGIAMGAQAPIPLTTVRQPVERIGAHAVDAVLSQIGGTPWTFPDLLTPELVIRASSGAPARMRTRELHLESAADTSRPMRSLAEHGAAGRADASLPTPPARSRPSIHPP